MYCWCQNAVLFPLYMQSTGYFLFPLPSCKSTCWGNGNNSLLKTRSRFSSLVSRRKQQTSGRSPAWASFRHTLQAHALHQTCAHVCRLARPTQTPSLLFWKPAVRRKQKVRGIMQSRCPFRLIGLCCWNVCCSFIIAMFLLHLQTLTHSVILHSSHTT